MNDEKSAHRWGSWGGMGTADLLTAYESFKHPKPTLRELKKKHKSLSQTLACMQEGMIVEDQYQRNPDHLIWLINDYAKKIADHEESKSPPKRKNKKPPSKVRRGRPPRQADEGESVG